MPSSYFASKHKKTARKITMFLILFFIIVAILQLLFPNVDNAVPTKVDSTNLKRNDTIHLQH